MDILFAFKHENFRGRVFGPTKTHEHEWRRCREDQRPFVSETMYTGTVDYYDGAKRKEFKFAIYSLGKTYMDILKHDVYMAVGGVIQFLDLRVSCKFAHEFSEMFIERIKQIGE